MYSRNYVIDQMNAIVAQSKGQFNTWLYQEYCAWQDELDLIDKKAKEKKG
jgi:hypothetical protein